MGSSLVHRRSYRSMAGSMAGTMSRLVQLQHGSLVRRLGRASIRTMGTMIGMSMMGTIGVTRGGQRWHWRRQRKRLRPRR